MTTSQACRRPYRSHVVVFVKGWLVCRQYHPRQFRTSEDVHVGRESRGVVERAYAHKTQTGTMPVVAPERRVARGTAVNVVRAPAVGRQRDGLRRAGIEVDPVRLNERVEHERASRLPL